MQVLETFKWSNLRGPQRFFSSTVLCLLLSSGCTKQENFGFLHVKAPEDGTYEVYRVASEEPFQLVSDEVGHFNTDMKLSAGSYLVLGDCSSQLVVINPERRVDLVAHHFIFSPPQPSGDDDLFVIQCNQSDATQSRQRLQNKYKLNVLTGTWDFLVGMASVREEFTLALGGKEPTVKKVQLSGLKVRGYEGVSENDKFFVSPVDDALAVTDSQSLGRWLFLMPGFYKVELNGSETPVELEAGEVIELTPGFLRLSTAPSLDLSLSSAIRGNPLYYEINGDHWLSLNETYPLLPGPAQIRLSSSEKVREVSIESATKVEQEVKSVVVRYDCPPFDWNCLGSKKVFLYQEDQHYSFAQGVTDVPILFLETDAWVGLEGSSGLRYHLDPRVRDSHLSAGILKLLPAYKVRSGVITDLTRVESVKPPVRGHTLDVPLDRESTMPLIAGSYNIAQYVTLTNTEGERSRSSRRIYVKGDQVKEATFPVFISEKKAKKMSLHQKGIEDGREEALLRRVARNMRPPRPAIIR